jgi:hypothetical protein
MDVSMTLEDALRTECLAHGLGEPRIVRQHNTARNLDVVRVEVGLGTEHHRGVDIDASWSNAEAAEAIKHMAWIRDLYG